MKNRIALWLAIAATAWVTGCAQMTIAGPGDVSVKDQIYVKLDTQWNRFNSPGPSTTYELWTTEGLGLDHLRFYPGIAVGQPLETLNSNAKDTEKKSLMVQPSMAPEQIAALVESSYLKAGGQFKITKLAPTKTMGGNGMRMEYSYVGSQNQAELSGLAYGLMQNNKLYLMTFHAPKTYYFAKVLPKAEAAMLSARLTR